MTHTDLIANPARHRLAANLPVTMLSLRQLRTADAAMIVRECGFDGFYVDREHGMYSDVETATLCTAGLMMGLLPAVRVRANNAAEIGGALDAGALCVIVPHVADAADAVRAVAAAKFPPAGDRSVAQLGPAMRYRSLPIGEIVRIGNEMTMVIAMLETADGVAAADAIAAVPGIDALMIGPTDLSAALGIPGELRHPRICDAYRLAAAAARRHGKQMVAGGAGGPGTAAMAEAGARIFLGGTDVGYLMAAARTASAALLAEAAGGA